MNVLACMCIIRTKGTTLYRIYSRKFFTGANFLKNV